MSCVLRVSGSGAVAAVAETNLAPYRSEGGEVRVLVSDADFHELGLQIEDAIAFLRDHLIDLQLLSTHAGIEATVDFGIARREVAAQFDRLPADLVELAGKARVGLEISQYPVSGAAA